MESSYNYVKETILGMIRSEQLPDNRLYSEGELVEMTGASRATVREVLRSLENEGVVTKRHGVGTFVHPQVLGLPLRIDQAVDFARMISDMGFRSEMSSMGDMKQVILDPADLLPPVRMMAGDKALKCISFSRLYTADGTPAGVCDLHFISDRLKEQPSGELEFTHVDDFCRKYLGSGPDHSMIFLSAVNADAQIAETLNISENTAIQVWDELLYDYRGTLMGYSRIYFAPVIPAFAMLRR